MHKVYYNDIDPYCCAVLEKQIRAGTLPPGDVDNRDIRTIHPAKLQKYRQVHMFAGIGGMPYGLRLAGIPDDFPIWTGGFPCQDLSNAGARAGLAGERSGLWFVWFDLICALRPRFVLVENVSALLNNGLSVLLGQMAQVRYDAEWHCIKASDVGAPHQRDRLWIVAYAQSQRCNSSGTGQTQAGANIAFADCSQSMANAHGERCAEQHAPAVPSPARRAARRADAFNVAHAKRDNHRPQVERNETDGPDPTRPASGTSRSGRRETESSMGRSADGLSGRLDGYWGAGWEDGTPRIAGDVPRRRQRLHGLGNAVVPQCVAVMGQRIREIAGQIPIRFLSFSGPPAGAILAMLIDWSTK